MKKYFLLFFFSLALFACGDETLTPGTGTANNNSPAAFTVSQTLSTDGKSIVLTWTAAKDPDGDAVIYDVTLDGKITATALTATTYTITGVDLTKSLTGKITAKDNKGGITETTFTTSSSTNKPPASFIVTPELQADNKTIVLKWTPAIDPEGDAVNYEVLLDGKTLVANLSQTTYSIVSLDYNVSKEGKVIARDAKGASVEVAFKAVTKDKPTTSSGDFVNIPDANFEQALIDLKIDKDGVVNGKMAVADAKGVTEIYVSNKNIKNLTGIEAFVDLQKLYCEGSFGTGVYPQLTSLDVSKNVDLQYLDCYHNQLTSLDITKNVKLQTLICSFNQLTSLDVSKNVALKGLRCNNNQLTNLDVSKNIALKDLNCYQTNLTSLDVSKNVALENLFCSQSSLKILNVSNNVALKVLECNNNNLTNLDVSKIVALESLRCYSNNLTNLDFSNNIALNLLICDSNNLTSLNVSKNITLTSLSCYSNKLTSLDVSKNIALKSLICASNQLTNLDITKNVGLTNLNAKSNQIKTICVADVAKATSNTNWLKDETATYTKCN